jgi:hypothetical protein
LYLVARLPEASEATRTQMAERFHFTQQHIALPPGLPHRHIRQVNPAYKKIQGWISSVGAGIAVSDLAGRGAAGDLCVVDSRSNSVIVTPAPNTGTRYAPFVLDPAPLPVDDTMAPAGCVPGDFNADGRMDLLVYYLGRTPILFLAKPGATTLRPDAYVPTELVPQDSSDGRYHGKLWQTQAAAIADFDGDGHVDIGIFNYWPDSAVLDPHGQPDVQMNHSMSRAENGGGAHILRWTAGGDTGGVPRARYEEQAAAIPPADATGWTLAASSADLDGDLLPELYIANDFGHDHLFHNVSTPGHIRFRTVTGTRGPLTPKSMALGRDSFKSMGVDFGDINDNGAFDCFVSNITTPFALHESNFAWMNTAKSPADARRMLSNGTAPFTNRAAAMNLAWSGWSWDNKMADFDNSGRLSVVQTTGFLKGKTNRWAWLQEVAMSNDDLLDNPKMWPNFTDGTDLAGSQRLAFWVREGNGRYTNLSRQLGLDAPIPTRGIAVSDTDGDGFQDFAVARQWGPPAFYRNDHPTRGDFLGLRLYRPADRRPSNGGMHEVGTPPYGAQAMIRTADGHTQLAQLDGGGGHSGKRSFDIFFGLGRGGDRPVSVELSWRDTGGKTHRQTLRLDRGWHSLMLDAQAREVNPT